jgi:predicted Zn-dependent protease
MHRLLILTSFAALIGNAQERSSVANFYSPAREAAMGAQLAAQVRSQTAVIENAAISSYVARVGNKLAAVLPDQGIKYTFTIIDRNLGGSTNEPLALPGGYVFVPANLLLAARSEDELSGMLAHAIAHVAARHGTRQATRAQLTNLTSPALVMFVNSPTTADESLLPGGLVSLEQTFEKEADLVAVGMMTTAGYDPEALASYVSRLQYDTAANQSSALPPRNERVAAIKAAIQQRSQNEFSQAQGELHRLLPASSPPPLVK